MCTRVCIREWVCQRVGVSEGGLSRYVRRDGIVMNEGDRTFGKACFRIPYLTG